MIHSLGRSMVQVGHARGSGIVTDGAAGDSSRHSCRSSHYFPGRMTCTHLADGKQFPDAAAGMQVAFLPLAACPPQEPVHSPDGATKTAESPRRRPLVAVGGVAAAVGSVGYMHGGPVLAAGLLTVAIVFVVLAVVLSAMLSRRDPRSPFVRLMLMICAIMGRAPRDYLPPAEGT
jgi:hypothetical protein